MVLRKATQAPIRVSLVLIVLYPFFAAAGEGAFRRLSDSAVSVVVVGLYLWRRNLWANIIAHTVIDLIAVLAVVFHIQA